MSKIRAELEQQLRASPDELVDLIVRTQDDPTLHLAWLSTAGLQVKQHFRLVPGVAVSGRGQDALKLLGQEWVQSVELDEPVSTM
jgi:hypothetical protein